MKRILALHGHTQSAHSFSRKFDTVKELYDGKFELVFVDAPHLLYPADFPGSCCNVNELVSLAGERGLRPRAWWRFLQDMGDSDTVIKTFAFIKSILETQGPFHGILGFSQGSALAAMVLAYLENPDLIPQWPHVKHPPLEFAILFSGFIPPSSMFPLPPKIRTSTLHIVGLNDIVVSPEMTIALAEHFANSRINFHRGAHFIPRMRYLGDTLLDFLKPFMREPEQPTIVRHMWSATPIQWSPLEDYKLSNDSENKDSLFSGIVAFPAQY